MNIKKDKIKVFDMTCTSCETRIEKSIKKNAGVKTAEASFSGEFVTVEYDSELCNLDQIKASIKSAGYSVESSKDYKVMGIFIIAAAIILIGTSTSGIDITSKLNGATYLVLFVVGALTSIHCVGMCGGIMLSQSINKESKRKLDSIKPAILYNAGRVLSYTVLGGLVGALGSVLSLSIYMKSGLQIFAGIFMIVMGLNMSGFGLFRKTNIRLPWSACSVKNKPKTPFFVGVLNGLMPCGPLQTMQLYALGTGSAYKGALAMLLFSLGTVPLMLTFGALSGLISKGYTKTLLKFSGILVVVLGIVMGSRGLALAGVNLPSTSSISNILTGINSASTQSSNGVTTATIENGVQIIRMTADGSGYTPNGLYVQKNIPVKWIIDGKALNSCNGTLVVPSLNKQLNLKPGENIIEFTPKDKDISFSCGMGMIRGVLKVVDDVTKVDTSKPDSSIPAASSGMACCNGNGSGSATTTQKTSIYGNDLSKISTDRLIHIASVSGSNQISTLIGTGYELDPLVVVVKRNINTTLAFNLNKFDNPTGTFDIVTSDTGKSITSFEGKKGIVTINFTFKDTAVYGISKNNQIIGAIVVEDDLKTVDLEKLRKELIGG